MLLAQALAWLMAALSLSRRGRRRMGTVVRCVCLRDAVSKPVQVDQRPCRVPTVSVAAVCLFCPGVGLPQLAAMYKSRPVAAPLPGVAFAWRVGLPTARRALWWSSPHGLITEPAVASHWCRARVLQPAM